MKNIILSIDGMTCSACSNGLEKYLSKQNGIIDAKVNLVMANASIDYDEKILDIPKIENLVKRAGFKSLGEYKEIKVEKQNKSEKLKFIIFTILAILLMYISMSSMISLIKFPMVISNQTHPNQHVILQFFIALLFLVYGFDILKSGCKNLIHGMPNMDTLVALGVLSSFLYSVYEMVMIINGNSHHSMNLYFESSAIVIYFVKLGRYLDGISKDKTKDAIKKLVEITPNKATIEVDGNLKEVTLDEIQKNTVVVARPGEKIAVDGEIIDGKAHLDEAFITGESKPKQKSVGDKVVAGSLNYDGFIKYKAEKIGKDSTVSEIVRLVIEASNTKAPIAKTADKISGYFVPIVIAIAILTFIAYLILGHDFSVALETFVTVLVVACPCSLGLATPLAIVVSEGLCAGNGILVKKSEILENASKIDTVVFDKTGTLTYGELKIAKINNYSNLSNDEIMKISGSLEKKSAHPIGKAFKNYISEHKITVEEVSNFEDISGYGIVGKIENNNIILGNRKIVEKYNIVNNYISDEENLSKEGCSVVYVAINNEIKALIGVNDIIRDNAKEVIKKLSDKNINTIMLTGDNEVTASTISKDLGITNIISNVLPKQKADMIKKLKDDGKIVMMCGDGINDSPALANADIGVSVKSGTDIAMDASQVILTNNNLDSIYKLLIIGGRTVKNIKQNLFWAFFYNLLMIPIAMGIFRKFGLVINPMIASLAMVFSSLTVILNTLRLKRIKILSSTINYK